MRKALLKPVLCLFAGLWLSGAAGGKTVGEHLADMPHSMGGLPEDAALWYTRV